MRIIDLSYPIAGGIPVFPGDDGVIIKKNRSLERDGYNYSVVTSGMHAGTHIDLPGHLVDDCRDAGEFPIEKFIGRGVLIDVRGEKVISYKPEYENLIKKDDIVLIFTDFASLYSECDVYYTKYPVLDDGITDFLIRKNIKIVGMDTPAPDRAPYGLHKKFLKNDITILENLTNLSSLLGVCCLEISAVPLKIQAEASLVRAYARIDYD